MIIICPILAKEQYIKRHDRVCAQLHFNVCKETGVQLAPPPKFLFFQTSNAERPTNTLHSSVASCAS